MVDAISMKLEGSHKLAFWQRDTKPLLSACLKASTLLLSKILRSSLFRQITHTIDVKLALGWIRYQLQSDKYNVKLIMQHTLVVQCPETEP